MSERNGAMVNGALITLGAVAILDNVVAHWLLGVQARFPTTAAPQSSRPGLSLSASCCL